MTSVYIGRRQLLFITGNHNNNNERGVRRRTHNITLTIECVRVRISILDITLMMNVVVNN